MHCKISLWWRFSHLFWHSRCNHFGSAQIRCQEFLSTSCTNDIRQRYYKTFNNKIRFYCFVSQKASVHFYLYPGFGCTFATLKEAFHPEFDCSLSCNDQTHTHTKWSSSENFILQPSIIGSGSFSTSSVSLITDHRLDQPKAVSKTTFKFPKWSLKIFLDCSKGDFRSLRIASGGHMIEKVSNQCLCNSVTSAILCCPVTASTTHAECAHRISYKPELIVLVVVYGHFYVQ